MELANLSSSQLVGIVVDDEIGESLIPCHRSGHGRTLWKVPCGGWRILAKEFGGCSRFSRAACSEGHRGDGPGGLRCSSLGGRCVR